jgi:ABC-type transporter Mla MlaB component
MGFCNHNKILFPVVSGRINLVELSKILNVDLAQITVKANEIERADSGCILVLGQLIDKSYIRHIAEEINERLSQQGQVSTADLTRQYDLPSDFLQSVRKLSRYLINCWDLFFCLSCKCFCDVFFPLFVVVNCD